MECDQLISLQSIYFWPGTVLDIGNIRVNKTQKFLHLWPLLSNRGGEMKAVHQ